MKDILENKTENILEKIKELEPDFIPPACKLVGEDGNAFAIMGRVTRALRRAKYEKLIPLYHKLAMSGDYDNLLYVSTVFVDADAE